MNELTNPTHASYTDLASSDSDSLKQRLAHVLARTANDLHEMAAIVMELEQRGEDLSDLKIGLIHHLRRIGSGQVLSEIVVKFAGNPVALERITVLPLSDQRRIADGEPLDMAVWRGDSLEWKTVDPVFLTNTQLRQVVGTNGIRSKSEQMAMLEDRREKTSREPPKTTPGKVYVNERGQIKLGRKTYEAAEIVAALASNTGNDTNNEERTKAVPVTLTDVEHRKLKQAALDGNSTIADLARRALRAYGLI